MGVPPYGHQGAESNAFSLIHERVEESPRLCRDAIICFTDIIGSSAMYLPDPHKGFEIARRKFEKAKSILDQERFRTHVAIIKTIGDALMLFAIDADVLTEFLCQLTKVAGCKFRSTMHSGDVLLWQTPFNNGNDCFGHTVNLASRCEQENKIWAKRSTSKIDFPFLVTESAIKHFKNFRPKEFEERSIDVTEYIPSEIAASIKYYCKDLT